MGLIPDDVIAEIRARADIVVVIGQHVQLRKAGRNWKGLCPFHGEKTPSFNVAPDKGFFYCFGCRKKGDAFTFIMEYQGKSFTEAAEVLAAQCGVTIPETVASPEAMRTRGERAQMLEINKLATQFFRETLASPRGEPGRAYLAQRGTGDAVRDAFMLGYAPADWHALADFLKQRRADLELAVKLGLVARQPRAGGFYDRFRERLVCPVVMPGGEIAGFSARLVASPPPGEPGGSGGPGQAKYINSPESTVYKKSRLLFGLAQAREGMHQKKRAVLVEGNFDVISLHQAGFTETVAPLGTALTGEQVELLRRLAGEVVLFYDGDRAGRSATRAALEIMVAAEVPVRIAARPRGDTIRLEGQDPDSLVRAGVDLAEMFDRARDGIEHYAFEIWSGTRGSSEARARALEDIARLTAKVGNPTKRDVLASSLATAMDVPVDVVQRAIRRAVQPGDPRGPGPGGAAPWRGDPRDARGAGAGSQGDPRGAGAGWRGDPRDPRASLSPEAHGARPAALPAPSDASSAGPPLRELDDELAVIALLADHPRLLATAEANGLFSLLTDVRLRDMYSAALRGASLVELAPDALPLPAAKKVLEARYATAEHPERQLLSMLEGLRTARHLRRSHELRRLIHEATRRGAQDEIRRLHAELTEHLKGR
jgi:DNA primase